MSTWQMLGEVKQTVKREAKKRRAHELDFQIDASWLQRCMPIIPVAEKAEAEG